jgi:hypothetical protein
MSPIERSSSARKHHLLRRATTKNQLKGQHSCKQQALSGKVAAKVQLWNIGKRASGLPFRDEVSFRVELKEPQSSVHAQMPFMRPPFVHSFAKLVSSLQVLLWTDIFETRHFLDQETHNLGGAPKSTAPRRQASFPLASSEVASMLASASTLDGVPALGPTFQSTLTHEFAPIRIDSLEPADSSRHV